MESIKENPAPPEPASLRTQLETLQTRIVIHGNRVWQLPFTYVSFAAIAASLVTERDTFIDGRVFFLALSGVGILVLWAMVDAMLSYRRTARNMNEVEHKLHLGEYTSGSWKHGMPHFAVCLTTIAALAFAAHYA